MSTLLKLSGVRCGYDKADVLHGVSLEAHAGAITCLLGSNGAGKSTLVRAIIGLTPARAGSIEFDGHDITRLPTHQIASLGLACIPEGRRMFPRLTVEENLRCGAYLVGDRKAVAERLEEAYGFFPRLEERRKQLAGTLSGGEQAMVSIARGLMSRPKLLIIDEPSLGLSPRFVKENFELMRLIRAQGTSILLIEQNVRQTLGISDWGYVLSQGSIAVDGDANTLLGNEEVKAAYFG